LNGITSIPNFMKFYQAVQKLIVEDTQTDRHTHTHTHTLVDRHTDRQVI
jgi:hypothetical protein